MAGLIWAGIGKGISDAGTAIGSTMIRGMERDEAKQIRERERADDLAYRKEAAAALLEDRKIAREERAAQDALYRKTVDQQLAGKNGKSGTGDGGGGGNIGPLTEEEKDFEALSMKMTRPEYDKFVASEKSGDKTGYAGYEMPKDGMGPPAQKYPAGFEKVEESKRTTLASIRAARTYGKDLDDVSKGQQGMFALDVSKGVLGGQIEQGAGASAVAAGKGDGAYGKGGVNEFTGKADQVGVSEINKNNSAAGKDRADGGAASENRLQSEITRAESTLATTIDKVTKQAQETYKLTDIEKLNPEKVRKNKEDIDAVISNNKDVIRQRSRVEELNAKGSTAPAAKTPPPAAKLGDNNGIVISTLPKGAVKVGTNGGKAVYETPDGKRFIQK